MEGAMQPKGLALFIDPQHEPNNLHVWCMLCGSRSKETQDQDKISEWCVDHSEKTKHTRYRLVKETYLIIGEARDRASTLGGS